MNSENCAPTVRDLANIIIKKFETSKIPVNRIRVYKANQSSLRSISFNKLNVYVAETKVKLCNGQTINVGSHGTGDSNSTRIITSVLECVERKIFLQSRTKVYTSIKDLKMKGLKYIDPSQMILYYAADRPNDVLKYDENDRVDWDKAIRLSDGLQVLVHRPTRGGAQGFFHHTTNGCAVGQGLEDAICRGLLELIERDALLLSWYSRPPPITRLLSRSKYYVLVKDWFEKLGFNLYSFDISSNVKLPVVISLIVKCGFDLGMSNGGVLCGLGSGITTEEALKKSLFEIIQAIENMLINMEERNESKGLHPVLSYYLSNNTKKHFNYLIKQKKTRYVSGLETAHNSNDIKLECILSRLNDLGIDPLYIHRKNSFLKSINLDYVETIAPGLLPLTLNTHKCGRRIRAYRLKNYVGNRKGWKEGLSRLPNPLG